MTSTAAPPRNRVASRLHSPVQARGTLGARMGTARVLDVVERLLVAAKHPDIVAIEQYGPGDGPWGPTVETSKVKHISGVRVTHPTSATASLWESVRPGGQSVPAPSEVPVQRRAPRLVVFVAQLLDYAKPEQFRSWELLTLPEIGPASERHLPFGLGIVMADGSKVLLQATSTSPTVGREPTEEPFPSYVIPEGVRTCL